MTWCDPGRPLHPNRETDTRAALSCGIARSDKCNRYVRLVRTALPRDVPKIEQLHKCIRGIEIPRCRPRTSEQPRQKILARFQGTHNHGGASRGKTKVRRARPKKAKEKGNSADATYKIIRYDGVTRVGNDVRFNASLSRPNPFLPQFLARS